MLIERGFRLPVTHYIDAAHTYAAFENRGCFVHERAKFMLESMHERWIGPLPLIVTSVAALGFPEGGSYENIRSRAAENKFYVCPKEVGPALRLMYLDQKPRETLYMPMVPILSKTGKPFVFVLCNGFGGLLLYSELLYPHTRLHATDRLVFVEL